MPRIQHKQLTVDDAVASIHNLIIGSVAQYRIYVAGHNKEALDHYHQLVEMDIKHRCAQYLPHLDPEPFIQQYYQKLYGIKREK